MTRELTQFSPECLVKPFTLDSCNPPLCSLSHKHLHRIVNSHFTPNFWGFLFPIFSFNCFFWVRDWPRTPIMVSAQWFYVLFLEIKGYLNGVRQLVEDLGTRLFVHSKAADLLASPQQEEEPPPIRQGHLAAIPSRPVPWSQLRQYPVTGGPGRSSKSLAKVSLFPVVVEWPFP